MVLTSAAIKTILDAGVYSETLIIKDYVENKNQRIFTNAFVEIDNQIPRQETEEITETETIQKFLIHLFKRVIARGSEEEAALTLLENEIKTELDGATLGGSILYLEEKAWNRNPREKPLQHMESILTVSVRDVVDTSGAGKLGAEMTLTLPGPIVIPLLSKPLELTGIEIDEDNNSGSRVVTPVKDNVGTISCEYESTTALKTSVKALVDAKARISVTLTKDGDPEAFNVLLLNVDKPVPYDEIERAILTMEVTS